MERSLEKQLSDEKVAWARVLMCISENPRIESWKEIQAWVGKRYEKLYEEIVILEALSHLKGRGWVTEDHRLTMLGIEAVTIVHRMRETLAFQIFYRKSNSPNVQPVARTASGQAPTSAHVAQNLLKGA